MTVYSKVNWIIILILIFIPQIQAFGQIVKGEWVQVSEIEILSITERKSIISNLPVSEAAFRNAEIQLKTLLAKSGHHFCEIKWVASNDSLYLPLVKLGPVTIIQEVSFFTDNQSEIIRDYFSVHQIEGLPFSKSAVENYLVEFLTFSSMNGYPFIGIEPEIRFKDQTHDTISVLINLKITGDQPVVISKANFIGLSQINEELAFKISGIGNGLIFNSDSRESIKRNLQKSELFEKIDEPELIILNNSDYRWQIAIKEANLNYFDGILGYIPEQNQKGGYFTGYVNIILRNFFGNARRFEIEWFKEDQQSQDFSISFREPYLFDYPLSLDLSFFQRTQDTTFLTRHLSGGINYQMTPQWMTGFSVQSTSHTYINETVSTLQNQFNSESIYLGFKTEVDLTNQLKLIPDGWLIFGEMSVGAKSLFLPDSGTGNIKSEYTQYKTDVAISNRFLVGNQQLLYSNINWKGWFSGFTDEPELYRVGGIKTIRGFRENQFTGREYILGNHEYRFYLSSKAYFFGFVDWLYIDYSKNIAGSRFDWWNGYGVGGLIPTQIGQIKIIFGLGNEDTFSTAKIHIGLESEF